MTYTKDFDAWNIRKKSLNSKLSQPPFFKEKEVWWLSIGANVGYEEDGKDVNFVRPVLVLKKYNRELFLGVPLSTKLKKNIYYIAFLHQGRMVSAIISQLRTYSSKRILNRMGELEEKDFLNIMESIHKTALGNLPLPLAEESRG